jgi:GH25 family lysozyme M1 (1,4-beta-N-acetylmuramidase)
MSENDKSGKRGYAIINMNDQGELCHSDLGLARFLLMNLPSSTFHHAIRIRTLRSFCLLTLGALALLSAGCATPLGSGRHFDGISYHDAPQILNVSGWDPKERQRNGESFTPDDVRAMRRSGAMGLIARASKGTEVDKKTHRFLAAADRQGMLLGAYHFVLPNIDAAYQANLFVDRIRRIANAQRLRNPRILMVADFDSKLRCKDMVRFILRMRELTGRVPVVYLENSDTLKTELRNADTATRKLLRQCPYWMALYNHVDTGTSRYSSPHPLTPRRLLETYRVWDKWSLWQYGGVLWDVRQRRSICHHYAYSSFRSPRYFGNLDRPTERSVFNGSQAELLSFWQQHAWTWRKP